jgi:hypothetical protein
MTNILDKNRLSGFLKKNKKNDFILFFNILRLFLAMRFFNVSHPIYYDINEIKFYSNMLKNVIHITNSFMLLNGISSYLKKISFSKLLKNKVVIKMLLRRYSVVFKKAHKLYSKNLHDFFKSKFKYEKIKKIRYLVDYAAFLEKNKVVKKKTESELELEQKKSIFIDKVLNNMPKLKKIYKYLKGRYKKKAFRRRISFYKSRQLYNPSFFRKRTISRLLFKRGNKIYRKKFPERKPYLRFKVPFKERQEFVYKFFKDHDNDKVLKRIRRIRKKKFRRKYI